MIVGPLRYFPFGRSELDGLLELRTASRARFSRFLNHWAEFGLAEITWSEWFDLSEELARMSGTLQLPVRLMPDPSPQTAAETRPHSGTLVAGCTGSLANWEHEHPLGFHRYDADFGPRTQLEEWLRPTVERLPHVHLIDKHAFRGSQRLQKVVLTLLDLGARQIEIDGFGTSNDDPPKHELCGFAAKLATRLRMTVDVSHPPASRWGGECASAALTGTPRTSTEGGTNIGRASEVLIHLFDYPEWKGHDRLLALKRGARPYEGVPPVQPDPDRLVVVNVSYGVQAFLDDVAPPVSVARKPAAVFDEHGEAIRRATQRAAGTISA